MPTWVIVVVAVLWVSVPIVGLALAVRELIKEDRKDQRREEESYE